MLGASSLKAALDVDWDEPARRTWALGVVLAALGQVEARLVGAPASPAQEALAVARQVVAQDVEHDADGRAQLRRGVARDRRISVEDAEMRHGRKSASHLFDGFKRHVGRDLDSGLVRVVGLTAANAPEASVTPALAADLAHQPVRLAALGLDARRMAYLLEDIRYHEALDAAAHRTFVHIWLSIRHGSEARQAAARN